MSGIDSAGNSMSTTGPMTRDTRPAPPDAAAGELSFRVAVIALSSAGGGVGEGVRATDDLADLLGDLGLAGVVRQPGVPLDQFVRVVGRGLHRSLARGELAGSRPQQGV